MSSRMDTSRCVFTPTGGKAPRKALAVRMAKRSAPKCGGVKQDRHVRTDITMALGDSQTRAGERKRKAALAGVVGSFEGEPDPPAPIILKLPMVQSYPPDVPTKRAALAVFNQQVDALTRRICGHAAKVLPTAPKAAALDQDEPEAAKDSCAASETAASETAASETAADLAADQADQAYFEWADTCECPEGTTRCDCQCDAGM